MENQVLGKPIKFKPVVGNLAHIKIMEVLGEIGKKRESLKKAIEQGKLANKLSQDISQLEGKARYLIDAENEKI